MAPHPALDLSQPPADRLRASGYTQLFELWLEITERLAQEPFSRAEFRDWEQRVLALLRPGEKDYFLQPGDPDLAWFRPVQQRARQKWLNKILLARKGVLRLSRE